MNNTEDDAECVEQHASNDESNEDEQAALGQGELIFTGISVLWHISFLSHC